MVMSTKDYSSPVLLLGYSKWIIFMFGLFSPFQKCAASDVNTKCPPTFTDNTSVILSCLVNKTYINAVSCGTTPSVSFYFGSPTGLSNLCFSPYPSGSCGTLPTGNAPCGCTDESGDLYTFQYNFTAIKAFHENGSITCGIGCFGLNITYFHEDTCSDLFSNKLTTQKVTLSTSENTTAGSTSLPTTASTHPNVSSSSVTITTNTLACNSTENCNQSDKCPVWCIIVVAVCVPCGGGGIIIIIVIIIKKKKAKTPGNSRPCTSPGQDENYEIEKISVTVTSQVVPDGTKTKPINSPGPDGNIETDITYTTVIKQARHDGTKQTSNPKHTKTENEENETSPEREKRRKKKKKKKPVQEVGGESVSREEKSTINGHKPAQKSQNDNSVFVDENSHATDSGEFRRLPIPKTSHLTSVERNSLDFQSETPRRLPPLQQKQ